MTDSHGITTEIITTSDIGKVEVTETVETTTTTTTVTTKTVSVSPTVDHIVKSIEPRIVKTDSKTDEEQKSREPTPNKDSNSSSPNSDSTQQNGNINTSQAAKVENKVIVIGSDGKQTPGIMNIQSVCPNTSKPGTTFVLLNKEGAQMKISLAPKKTENSEKSDDSKEEQENGQPSKNLHIS